MFIQNDELLEAIKGEFSNYTFKEYFTEEWDDYVHKCKKEDKKRSDKKYRNSQEKKWAEKLRAAMRKQGIEDTLSKELVSAYLKVKNDGVRIGPTKWLKLEVPVLRKNKDNKMKKKKKKKEQQKDVTIGSKLQELLRPAIWSSQLA